MSLREDQDSASYSHDGEILASIKQKEWETNFFLRKFGTLNLNPECALKHNAGETQKALISLLDYADRNEFDVIELQMDVMGMELAPFLEDNGFHFVDTRITFLTLMEKSALNNYPFDEGAIGFATKKDLSKILELTHKSFSNNPFFYSRFKNRVYFSEKETEAYYEAWVVNNLETGDSMFGALKKGNKIIGYSILKESGEKDGKKICKNILSTIDRDYRGYNAYLFIQSFLCSHFPEENFYLDNTTQLSNMAMIQNHIKSQKRLNRMGLIFYRKRWKNIGPNL